MVWVRQISTLTELRSGPPSPAGTVNRFYHQLPRHMQGCESALISSGSSILGCGFGSGSSILGWMAKKLKKNYSWKKLNFFYQKLQFTYPKASIKNVQVTEEAFSCQKRPSNTSKHEPLKQISTFGGHFCPPGSGSGFPNTDLDPLTRLNPDPDPQPWSYVSLYIYRYCKVPVPAWEKYI